MDAKQCHQIINTHVQQERAEREEIDQWVKWYNSEAYDRVDRSLAVGAALSMVDIEAESDAIEVETNFTFAWIDTMTANVCPLNPQITLSTEKEEFSHIAKARQSLINASFQMDDAYDLAVDFATYAGISGRGITKVVWNATLGRPEATTVHPCRFFFDRSVPFKKARYACEVTLVTEDEMKARLEMNRKPDDEGKPTYNQEVADQVHYGSYPEWFTSEEKQSSIATMFRWAVVYEFWDFVADKYYHFLDGIEEPLLEAPLPYKYFKNPFVVDRFNRNLKDHSGLSDVKLIASSQEQLNEINSLELTHASKSIPFAVINTALLDEPDEFKDAVQAVNRPGAVIEMKSSQVRTADDVISYSKTPSLTPAFATMRDELKGNINFTLAFAAHERGQSGDSKLATELSMMADGLQTRNGRRVKVMDGWVVGLAKRYLGLWRQFLVPGTEAPGLTEAGDVGAALDTDTLGFTKQVSPEMAEKEWWFVCKPVPYSPGQNNRLVQLRSIQQFFPVLNGNPAVDQQRLVRKLLDLLELSDLVNNTPVQQAAPAGAMAGGAANMPAGAPGSGGEMPQNVAVDRSEMLVNGTADQPKVVQ